MHAPTRDTRAPIRCVLFDLDGTLADTVPDLGGAANALLTEHSLPRLPIDAYRAHISQGARGMLRVAFGIKPEEPGYAALNERFLDLYAECLDRDTCLFPGVEPLLQQLDAAGLPWGIVTNKFMRFARPVVAALGLASRSRCLVAGDSVAHRKPAPDPLLMACKILEMEPASMIYVGDDPRDIEAGRAAGMTTAAACWGYLPAEADPADWGADVLLQHMTDLIELLELARAI